MFPVLNLDNNSPADVYSYISNVIGSTFHEYRENSKLSLRDIYNAEKVSMAVVSDLENGKKLPRVETLIRLLNLVKMPYSDVFNNDILPDNSPVNTRFMKIQNTKYPDIKELLLVNGFSNKEIEQITLFMDFIVSKRK